MLDLHDQERAALPLIPFPRITSGENGANEGGRQIYPLLGLSLVSPSLPYTGKICVKIGFSETGELGSVEWFIISDEV